MSAVSEIRYVAYGVTDFESERTFYRDKWGLREVQADDQGAYFAADGGDELYVVKLRQASEKRVDVISFAAPDRAAINQLFERVQAAKCRIIFPPRALDQFGGGYGFRFFSPAPFGRSRRARPSRKKSVTLYCIPRTTRR
jgi:catechol 2,3-dioxygenase-like lactoylglutathione lyase family enzyme